MLWIRNIRIEDDALIFGQRMVVPFVELGRAGVKLTGRP